MKGKKYNLGRKTKAKKLGGSTSIFRLEKFRDYTVMDLNLI